MNSNNADPSNDQPLDSGGDSKFREGPLIAPVEALVGTQLDQYLILSEIGRGSMGVVFEAFDQQASRKIALKVLPPNINLSDKVIQRFLREAESVAKLDHPNIVKIFGIGHKESIYYYAMELVEGRPLDEILEKEHPLPFKKVANIIIQACDALHFAHRHQIMHRDIKPGNIIITHDNRVVITDFGLARQEKAATLTESGALVGTPIYMSPEQVMAKRGGVDKRTDIYSLGITLYQLLTGKPPFLGTSTQRILNQILEDEPRPPHRVRRDIPGSLSVITMKSLEKEPGERFQSASEMKDELTRYLSGSSIKSKPAGMITRIGKRIKKHKVISALASLTIILIIAFSTNLIHLSKIKEETNRDQTEIIMEEREKNLNYYDKIKIAKDLLAQPSITMNLPTAFNLLNEANRLFPERYEAHLYLGKAFSLQKDPSRAWEEFCFAVEYCPQDSFEALLARAEFLLDQGRLLDFDNALILGYEDLSDALERDKENPRINYLCAKTLYDCTRAVDLDFEERRSITTTAFQYAQSAQSFGTTADTECLLAQIYFEFAETATSETERTINLNSALQCLDKVLQLDKNHLFAARLRQELMDFQAQGPEAGPLDTQEIIDEQSGGSWFTHAGEIYNVIRQDIEETWNDAEKRERFESLVNVFLNPQPKLVPNTSDSRTGEEAGLNFQDLIDKAADHMESKNYHSAIRCYKKAGDLDPGRAHEMNYLIADAYFVQGNQEELGVALQHARLAYTQEPQNGPYLQKLAQILFKLDDKEGLKKLYGEAKKNGIKSFLGIDLPFLTEDDPKSIPH